MNAKESHIVTGMSRDSAVSRQNPNLVYDANNIRITTKDGRNTVLSVTNERGTKQVTITSGNIEGTPIGSAILGDYIVIFTHKDTAYKDHIYKCEFTNDSVAVTTVFEGDAGFDLAHPLETLPIFETEAIQKVYWVDGIHQPRMIDIMRSTIETVTDKLNFSREIVLKHKPIDVVKTNGGGLFPPGTIQYMFSYYDLNGQETRLIDVSPMFYLSPKEKGAKADQLVRCTFTITLETLDTSFSFVRLYSIVRTQENAIPQARIVGDYPCNNKIVITDDGTLGSTIDANSLYFIGGEECIAGTIAQKDNTLFLGDITLTRPNLIDISYGGSTLGAIQGSTALGTAAQEWQFYSKESTSATDKSPQKNNEYYDYTIDNNRSSYFIKRFKHGEYYRLGFIAQYRNGQWSDPLWVDDMLQNLWPMISQDYYETGAFKVTIPAAVATAMKNAGYRRLAPVVVCPTQQERDIIAQGVICPVVYQTKDRSDNAPYAQSSWFFRYAGYANSGRLAGNNHPAGEIQCQSPLTWQSGEDDFYVDGNMITFNSPEVDCVDSITDLDLSDSLQLYLIGTALSHKQRIMEHFITTENVGINADISQVISIKKNTLLDTRNDYFTHNFPLYCDSIVNNDETDEVEVLNAGKAVGWIVYPWHRQGSLNNQKVLSTKQEQNGFTTRTAMLKRNITATTWFTTINFNNSPSTLNIGQPSLYNADQLAAVRVRSIDKTKSYNYYGNVDKVLVPSNAADSSYDIYNGWYCNKSELSTKSAGKRSEEAITIGYNSTANTNWKNYTEDDTGQVHLMKATDPVPMKYKSSPHLVMCCAIVDGVGNANNPEFRIAELRRNATHVRTNSTNIYGFKWIRCGESVDIDDVISDSANNPLHYQQGDCYVQRYDCLKTYPFTNEDLNSVIEIFSMLMESYVNLDFRTDSNRGGTNNYIINPTNFNLFNHTAYEQSGNFFTYRSLNPNIARTNRFPNVVTWSLEKNYGEDVDTWASVDVSNTVDLDGAMGNLTKLINYNNDIYAFQSTGFAQLLFNSRVQIPASDGVPIEITNGMKMQGKRYISTKVGCTNKWSIVETPLGLYFIDDVLRTTYLFNGQLQDISTTKGMKSWMNDSCNNSIWDVQNFGNCRAFYDKIGKDIYWIYDDIALVYSEILGQYMSFMSYGGVPLLESINEGTYAITRGESSRSHAYIRIPTINNDIHEDTTLSFILDSNYNKVVNLSVDWETESSNQESIQQEAPRRSALTSYVGWTKLPFTNIDANGGSNQGTVITPIGLVFADNYNAFALKGYNGSAIVYQFNNWEFEGHQDTDYNDSTTSRPRTDTIFYNRDNSHYYAWDDDGRDLVDLGTEDPTATFSVSPQSLSFAQAGEQKTFTISTSSQDISWSISKGNATWLTLSSDSGTGNGTIIVTASSNPNTSQRTATISIGGSGLTTQTISVTQDAQEAGTSSAADVTVTSTETVDTVQVTLYTCEDISSNAYTIGDLLYALREKLPEFLNASADKPNTYSLEYKDKDYYDTLSTSLFNSNSAPLWKLNAGNYNEFFGVYKPYYLTFISNGYPTENKIFNNIEWRDIVSAPNGVTKPLVTFDHIRVWNENQDTQSVLFTNSISENSSRQPISYSAVTSNLRKKFNVWRCQIPRDRKATNTSRARISNPWCYIKLSRDNMNTDRHQLTDMAVEYFM